MICTSTWLLVVFLVLCNQTEDAPGVLRLIPDWLLPLFSWLVFLLYICFPSKNYFNGSILLTCKFVFADLWSTLKKRLEFLPIWASSQLFSFVILIDDAIYSLLFTIDRIRHPQSLNATWNIPRLARVLALVFAILISVHKLAQNSNQIYFAKNRSEWVRGFLELGVHFLLLVCVVLSLIWTFLYLSIVPLVVMICLVTLASFFFDLVFHFGFLSFPRMKGEFRVSNHRKICPKLF